MYRTEPDRRNYAGMLLVGLIILALAIVGIALAISYSNQRAYEAGQTNRPVETQPPQVIEVERPVVHEVPVYVPVERTVTQPVPVPVPTAPVTGNGAASEANGTETRPSGQPAGEAP